MAEGIYTKITAIASALGLGAGNLALAAAIAWSPRGASGAAVTGGGVTVSGPFGRAPRVTFPASDPPSGLVVDTVIRGNGPVLHRTDAFAANFVVYRWHGTAATFLQSTFRGSGAQLVSGSELLRGLETALDGKKMGSRVLAILPPAYAYGSSGNPPGVGPDDTVVFVLDLIGKFPARASAHGVRVSSGGGSLPAVTTGPGGPAVRIPGTPPPAGLIVKTLIQGAGPRIARRQLVVVQYVGVNWRTGKVFDSSWARGAPFGFQIGVTPQQVIDSWNSGLLGVRTGSRILMVVPPSEGYGSAGNQQAGIRGTDTLVFVIDVLGIVNLS